MSNDPQRTPHMHPGYRGTCCWDSDGGVFVVLRSPNPRGETAWLTEDQGLDLIADWYAVDPSLIQGAVSAQTWRTVLAKECNGGFHDVGCGVDGCEQGNYCSQGSGARWAEVLGIGNMVAQVCGSADANQTPVPSAKTGYPTSESSERIDP